MTETIFDIIKSVSLEMLTTVILVIILVGYFIKCCIDKSNSSTKKDGSTMEERFMEEYVENYIKQPFVAMTGHNRENFAAGVKAYMEKNKLKVSLESVRRMVSDYMIVGGEKADKIKEMILEKGQGPAFLEAIYKNAQLGMGEGPEYDKLMAKVQREISKKMKKIDMNEMTSGNEMTMSGGKYLIHDMQDEQRRRRDMVDDMNMQMHQQLANDMEMQMQMQMQQQMMIDMEMQMQMQLQQQMMMEMQMQMQQQMMNDMQQQMMNDMQMNLDTMSMSNMAITQTDFGGFMDNGANSGSFGPF